MSNPIFTLIDSELTAENQLEFTKIQVKILKAYNKFNTENSNRLYIETIKVCLVNTWQEFTYTQFCYNGKYIDITLQYDNDTKSVYLKHESSVAINDILINHPRFSVGEKEKIRYVLEYLFTYEDNINNSYNLPKIFNLIVLLYRLFREF